MPESNLKVDHDSDAVGEVSIGEAAQVLAHSYANRAGEEALFRALLAERDLNEAGASFWMRVYERLKHDRVFRVLKSGVAGH